MGGLNWRTVAYSSPIRRKTWPPAWSSRFEARMRISDPGLIGYCESVLQLLDWCFNSYYRDNVCEGRAEVPNKELVRLPLRSAHGCELLNKWTTVCTIHTFPTPEPEHPADHQRQRCPHARIPLRNIGPCADLPVCRCARSGGPQPISRPQTRLLEDRWTRVRRTLSRSDRSIPDTLHLVARQGIRRQLRMPTPVPSVYSGLSPPNPHARRS